MTCHDDLYDMSEVNQHYCNLMYLFLSATEFVTMRLRLKI